MHVWRPATDHVLRPAFYPIDLRTSHAILTALVFNTIPGLWSLLGEGDGISEEISAAFTCLCFFGMVMSFASDIGYGVVANLSDVVNLKHFKHYAAIVLALWQYSEVLHNASCYCTLLAMMLILYTKLVLLLPPRLLLIIVGACLLMVAVVVGVLFFQINTVSRRIFHGLLVTSTDLPRNPSSDASPGDIEEFCKASVADRFLPNTEDTLEACATSWFVAEQGDGLPEKTKQRQKGLLMRNRASVQAAE